MLFHQISDWNDAYANGPNIPGGERWPAAWVQPAQNYRDELDGSGRATLDIGYGEQPRNRFDLFRPEGRPKGLVVSSMADSGAPSTRVFGHTLRAAPSKAAMRWRCLPTPFARRFALPTSRAKLPPLSQRRPT